MNQQINFRILIALVAAAGLAVLPGTSGTEDAAAHHTEIVPAPDAGSTPGTAAMRAYLNPETGALEVGVAPVGSAAYQTLDPATQNALRRDANGLVETYHPDGSVSVNLQGRFQSVSVRKKTTDGDVQMCTDNPEEALRVLRGRTTPEVK
jgi:hypothetical protein